MSLRSLFVLENIQDQNILFIEKPIVIFEQGIDRSISESFCTDDIEVLISKDCRFFIDIPHPAALIEHLEN